MRKNIFFDFNGTIIDDVDLSYSIELEIVDKYHLHDLPFEDYRNNFKIPIYDFYEYLGVPKDKYSEVSSFFFSEYTKRMPKETKVYDGIVDLFKRIKKEGGNIYILSVCERTLLLNQLKLFKIDQYIDDVACLDDQSGRGKEDIGRKFIKEHNIDPGDSCLIGDTIHDYDVAKALGLKSILYTKGHNSKELLSKCKDATLVDSFNNIDKYLI